MDRRILSILVVAAASVWGVVMQASPVSIVWGARTEAPSAPAPSSAVFTFFLHDNFYSPSGTNDPTDSFITAANASAFAILPELAFVPYAAPSNETNCAPSYFGMVGVFDDALTTEPDPKSLEVGRGRGMYVWCGNDDKGALIEYMWTAEFNSASGHHEGTTLTFKGRWRLGILMQELPIVGGTGKFRMARGWADTSQYSLMGIGEAILNVTANVYYGI